MFVVIILIRNELLVSEHASVLEDPFDNFQDIGSGSFGLVSGLVIANLQCTIFFLEI